jgi:hypothetical protein
MAGPAATPTEDAEARVERIFERLSRREVPIWPGVARSATADVLTQARRIATEQAASAGRGALLEAALERVRRAYALHLGDQGYWTAVLAVSVPVSPADRAASELVVEDLVRAAVVQDLLPASVVDTLRADAEDLLGAGTGEEGETGGEPPATPFAGPLVAASAAGAVVLALAWDPWAGIVVAAVAVAVLVVRRLRG